VEDFCGDAMGMEEIGQCEESHRQEVNPEMMMDGPIVIDQLGNVEKKTIQSYHRGNCKMSESMNSTLVFFFTSDGGRIASLSRLGLFLMRNLRSFSVFGLVSKVYGLAA